MPNRTDNTPSEPTRTPQANRILSTPDTVAQCRTELRTSDEQKQAAEAADLQFVFTRIAAGGRS